MLSCKKIDKVKIDNYYINLNKSFNLLYFKELLNTSGFVIYFNYNNLSNKDLYYLKNEILKKGLKNYVATKELILKSFDKDFHFLNSNVLFIFCNSFLHFMFVSKLLYNTNFFCIFNKCFGVSKNNINLSLNSNLNHIHFILFKLLFNLLIVILFYIINLIKNIKVNL